MARKEQRRATERISIEDAAQEMLVALARAHNDPRRPIVREKGIEERDLAFEAGFIEPPDMELTIYGTQRRNRILRLIREMQTRGWCQAEQLPPTGAYYVRLLPAGQEAAVQKTQTSRSWWQRMVGGKS